MKAHAKMQRLAKSELQLGEAMSSHAPKKEKPSNASFVAIALACASGCWGGINHNYTHTAHESYNAKGPTCDFDIQATGPSASEYAEIGTVGGCSGTTDLGEYKEQITPFVCQAAGDLVMAEINTNGVYCRGIVFHKVIDPPKPSGG